MDPSKSEGAEGISVKKKKQCLFSLSLATLISPAVHQRPSYDLWSLGIVLVELLTANPSPFGTVTKV